MSQGKPFPLEVVLGAHELQREEEDLQRRKTAFLMQNDLSKRTYRNLARKPINAVDHRKKPWRHW